MVLIGNAAKDWDFVRGNCGIACRPGSPVCSNLHHSRRANSKSVSARLLREQDLLRDFEEDRSGFTAGR